MPQLLALGCVRLANGKSSFLWFLPAAIHSGSRVFYFHSGLIGQGVLLPNSTESVPVMLYATELMGSAAYDAQDNFVGRVREFFIEPAEQPNRVSHFLISRGRFQPLVARYDQVSKVVPGRIDLPFLSGRSTPTSRMNHGWRFAKTFLISRLSIQKVAKSFV